MKEKIGVKLENAKNVIWIIVASLLTIGLNLQVDYFEDKIYFEASQIIWLMIAIFLYFILKKSSKYNNDKRLFICSFTLAIMFAFFQTIGQITYSYWSSHEVNFTQTIIIYFLVKIPTYTIIFTNAIKIIIKTLENIKLKERKDIIKPKLKVFLIVAILFFIAWLPYFLNFYPGITSYDTNYQLMQGYEIYPCNNHHPIIHTIMITIITKIGYAISGNYNFGIALNAILQMIVSALVFSFVIYYMGKKKVSPIIKMITFLFFALHPIIPQFSISIWKDVPFSLSLILFIIGIVELITDEENFVSSYKWKILFIIAILGTAFFRNNGIYIIVLTFPFVLIAKRKYWKSMMLLFVIPIVLYFIITGPGFKALGIGKSSIREMLSIPLQQMARISVYKSEELTQEEKDKISVYLPIEKMPELYRPNISDTVKNEFDEKMFYHNKIAFVKLYFELAFKYPLETMQSFICNTYGYYCPDIETFPLTAGIYTKVVEKEKFMQIETNPIIKIPVLNGILEGIYTKQIPIVGLLTNIGLVFWIILILLVCCFYQKRYQHLLMFIPIAILYLTCLASPVSGELRYVYGMFITLPIFLAFTLQKS